MKTHKLGIVGVGVMGEAIIGGAMNAGAYQRTGRFCF